jgi:ABC-type multidrug transport system ATPase subunit
MAGEGSASSSRFQDFSHLHAGAKFLRADLHIHSYGVSSDVEDAGMTVPGIVQAAAERGLDLIAITDHNAIDSVSDLLDATSTTAIAAFPGTEITTAEGHVLVYFPPDAYDAFSAWFARLDFKKDSNGDRHTLTPIHDLLKQVEEAGGLAVPAHIGRPNTGFTTRVSAQTIEAVVTSPFLHAVEIDAHHEGKWYSAMDDGDGSSQRKAVLQRREAALGDYRGSRLAKLLFSDAHSVDMVGRDRHGQERLTRIKMGEPTFDAFRTALADPEARIKLEADLPADYPRITGVRLLGGFLDQQEIALSPNLTCLIGGRGAGKSTLLESIRCTCLSSESELDEQPNSPETVQLIYRDSYGHDHYLKRDVARATYELTADGAVETTIPIEGYDQDRIAAITRGYQDDPRLLLDFLDQFVDVESASDEINARVADLEANARASAPLLDAPSKLSQAQKQLKDTRLKLTAMEGSNLKDALEWRRRLQRERQVRGELEERLREMADTVDRLDVEIDLRRIAEAAEIDDLSNTPSARVLLGDDGGSGLVATVETLAQELRDWRQEGRNHLIAAKSEITAAIVKWNDREHEIEGKVQAVLEQLRTKGIKPDLTELNRLTTAEANTVKTIRNLDRDVKKLAELAKQRSSLLSDYQSARARRFQLRRHAMAALTGQLNDAFDEFKVKLGFQEGLLVDKYFRTVRAATNGRFLRNNRLMNLCRTIDPISLAEVLHKNNVNKLLALTDDADNPYFATADEASEFADALRKQGLASLEQVDIDDLPEISLTEDIGGDPRKVDFAHLSFGQKASILLGALLFSSDQSPLIIDQPEDHLDSQFISRTVVRVLRRVKEKRQVIIATHNANITVLGDAEQIVPLQGYQGKGHIRDVGSVDAEKTRSRACEILEGGESAYRRRGEMYGLAVSPR